MISGIYQAKVDAHVTLLVWIREYSDGEKVIEEILDIVSDVKEFDNVRET